LGTGSVFGGKAAGAWPPTSSAQVKVRVVLYVSLLPVWAFVTCYRVDFTSTSIAHIFLWIR
jgi:hypothetical protein